ncbi:hypothetical protein Slin15195_G082520 [Septoria linicola]|uniref:Uncharacterized protein n=1 Tax=Septoria linicola TaxID=215465 RepID=A0A9Q9EMX9_9PEZI|nr:hypothetical protein Slin15195_G082520 [Septoria linicola]
MSYAPADTTTAAGTTDTPTTPIDAGAVITSPVVQASDSAALPSSQVEIPSDLKSFTAAYSVEDNPLPTVVAMGSSPLAEGLLAPSVGPAALPFATNPTIATAQFNMLGLNFHPLGSTVTRLQPLPAPTMPHLASRQVRTRSRIW